MSLYNLNSIAAVAGMVVLAVLAAGLVTRYQQSQQQRRARIRQLVAGVRRLEELLLRLVGVSLPRDIRCLLRQDILNRYRAVHRVHRGYPGVDKLIRQAEQRLGAEGPDAGAVLPVPPDPQTFERWIAGLHEVAGIIRHGRLLEPVPVATRNRLFQQLQEREVECMYGYHMNEADKFKQAGRLSQALYRARFVRDRLRALGMNSERIRGLLNEAEQACQFLQHGANAVTGSVGAAAPSAAAQG
jgi:hypothetical protein